MSSWRDRLCGSPVTNISEDENHNSLRQYANPSGAVSDGGGHYPVNLNTANMKTFKGTFLLPTKDYAVLVFRDDGSAVIYTDSDTQQPHDDELIEGGSSSLS